MSSSEKKLEKAKRARLVSLTKGKVKFKGDSEISAEQVEEDLRNLKASELARISPEDEKVFSTEKSALLQELDSMSDPIILEMPDFLTDPSKEDERRKVMEKVRHLLNRRFSLITIADILQTNDYSKLDEIIERKEETYKAVEKYTGEDGEQPLRLFSDFKGTVGDEYSSIYVKQEERMKAAINILLEGSYFKEAESKGEDPRTYIEDIIANIIDHPEFNLACQVETEFVISEMKKAERVLSGIGERIELAKTIAEIQRTREDYEERSHKLSVINNLMSGKTGRTEPEENNGDER